MDTDTLLDHLEDALYQGGDSREVDGEHQVGHLCLSTWESIRALLIEAGRLEPVGDSEYWARRKRAT